MLQMQTWKSIVAALAVAAQLAASPVAFAQAATPGRSAQAVPPKEICPLGPAAAAATEARSPGGVRFQFAGTDALLRLHSALSDDDQAVLEDLRAYFLKAGGLFSNNMELAGLATERLAQLNHDPAMLAEARAMIEKALVKLRLADSSEDQFRIAVSSDLIRIKLLQAGAAGGAVGVGLMKEALADEDRLMRKFASDLSPESMLKRRQQQAEVKAGLVGIDQSGSGLLVAIKDYESLLAQSTDPREERGTQIKLVEMLIRLSQLQAGEDALSSAKRARALIQQVIQQKANLVRYSAQDSQLNQLAGNLKGSWQVTSRYSTDCFVDAALRIVQAKVDILLAADESAAQGARQRLLEADALLAATPAYLRDPDPLLAAAASFLKSGATAPPAAKAVLRQNASSVLDEAQRRIDHCFCAFSQERLAKLRAELDRI